MIDLTRPMLAADVDVRKGALEKLRFPLIGTPKFDGLRCIKHEGKALSRSFKPIRNRFTRDYIERFLRNGIDGELIVGPIEIGKTFSEYTAGLTAFEGEPDFTFYAFDMVKDDLNEPYWKRIARLARWCHARKRKRVVLVPWRLLHSLEELLEYEASLLELGYEGVCLRDKESPYKCGRSTFNQHWLLKLKRFKDGEAEIVGFVEMLHNKNKAKVNELGLTSRSTSKAGKVPAGILGTFQVRDLKDGTEFEIGTGRGLTHELRRIIFENQGDYLGKIIKYKFQESGMKDKPRIGSYLGFRDPEDMDP